MLALKKAGLIYLINQTKPLNTIFYQREGKGMWSAFDSLLLKNTQAYIFFKANIDCNILYWFNSSHNSYVSLEKGWSDLFNKSNKQSRSIPYFISENGKECDQHSLSSSLSLDQIHKPYWSTRTQAYKHA